MINEIASIIFSSNQKVVKYWMLGSIFGSKLVHQVELDANTNNLGMAFIIREFPNHFHRVNPNQKKLSL
ncbi:hypothetical protein VNO77_24835 [Canavalia gladiata]|uniref:Uncharacterized protein n=1 Tax=Canavalia gladiata TaxID=3824 RepID=A0AAN9L9J3_CANGL